MAIVSKFYTGSVDHVDWSQAAGEVGSLYYGAEDYDAWKPTVVSGVDRTVRIGTGTVFGRGVRDTKDVTTDVQLPSTSSANGRWDLIVARRTWGTSTTTVTRVAGTSSKAIPAGRNVGPGVVDDQPIALAKVSNGSTNITELVDLRAFGAGVGGLQVLDKLALQYLNFPGAVVYVGSEVYVYPAAGPDWVKVGNFGGIQLFGADDPLSGSVTGRVTNKSPFLVQAGTNVATSDNFGYARLTFPVPFPNGLLTVLGFNGDGWTRPGFTYESAGGTTFGSSGAGNKVDWVYKVVRPGGTAGTGLLHRINWIALGF